MNFGPNGLRAMIGHKQIFSGVLKLLYSMSEFREFIIGLDCTEATPLSQALKSLFLDLQKGAEIVDQDQFFVEYEKKHQVSKDTVRLFISHVISIIDAEFELATGTFDKPMESILRGDMRQNFFSESCGHKGKRVFQYIDLAPAASSGEMESILREMYSPEVIGNGCDVCQDIVETQKWLDVESWPRLLIVNLFNTRNITPDLFGYEFMGVSILTRLGYVRSYVKSEENRLWYLYGANTRQIDVGELERALKTLNSGAAFIYRKVFGVEVLPECKERFHEMAELKQIRYIIFKIENREIVVEKAVGIQDTAPANLDVYADNSKTNYEQFMQDLKTITQGFKECRYAVFDFKFTGMREGASASKREKIVFFQIRPEGADFEQRTIYGRSAEALKRTLDPVKFYALQVSDEAEMAHEEVMKISGKRE